MITEIITPRWVSFHNSLARILNMSIGIVSAAGELVALYNALPPLSEMKRYPNLHQAYRFFFLQVPAIVGNIGKPEIFSDPLDLPVAVIKLDLTVFLCLAGGYDKEHLPPQRLEDYGIPAVEASGLSKTIEKINLDELKMQAESITTVCRQMLSSVSESRKIGRKTGFSTTVEEIGKLTTGLLHPGKFAFSQILDLMVNSLLILADAEDAFIFTCRRSVCNSFHRGIHEDFLRTLGEQWERTALQKPDSLNKWKGFNADEDLQLHLTSFAKKNIRATLGVVSPQFGEDIEAALEAFGRQVNVVMEISLFYELLEKQIGALLNTIRYGIIAVNDKGRTMVYNLAAQKIFKPLGITLHVGRPLSGPGLPSSVISAVHETLFNGNTCFFHEDLIDGHNQSCYLSFDILPLKWENGDIAGAIIIIEDITVRVQTERALRQREQECKTLLENIPDIICRFNRELQCIFINNAVEKQFGLPGSDFIGKKIEDMAFPEESALLLRENLLSAFTKGEVTTINLELAKHQQSHYFSVKFVPEFDVEGTVQTVLTVTRNITEQKMMENEFLKSSTLESIGVLAGGIAHDFNNFLATMLANVTLAKLYKDDLNKLSEKMESIEAAIMRAKELSNQLLIFAKGSEPIKKTMDIRKLLKESTCFALSGSSVSSEFSLSEDLLPVEIDEGQINQVINNLIINAVQAMPQGGKIMITARNIELKNRGKEHFLPLPNGHYVVFSIADEGYGIVPEHLPKIFEPFFSTKKKGSGLGLATSNTIIQKHNGHIEVKSAEGAGTTFSVYLPATNEEELIQTDKEAFVKGKGRVLLMDDKESIRKSSGEMLSFLGYEVEFACDGLEAIKLYQKAEVTGRPFDAVILDLTVPGGMGGKAAIKELLSIDPGVKAVVASGYSNDPVLANYKDYGFKAIAIKPYKLNDLSRVMHELTIKVRDAE